MSRVVCAFVRLWWEDSEASEQRGQYVGQALGSERELSFECGVVLALARAGVAFVYDARHVRAGELLEGGGDVMDAQDQVPGLQRRWGVSAKCLCEVSEPPQGAQAVG